MFKESIKYRATKNFSSLMIAQVIYKICTFLMMILMARFLGPEKFGQLSFGLSFVWVFLFIFDFGFSELFVRDVSYRIELLDKYINNIVTLKIYVSAIAYLFLAALAWNFARQTEKFWIMLLLGAATMLDSFMYFFRALFRVRETMEYEGFLMIIEAFLKLAVVFIAVSVNTSMEGAVLMAAALLVVSALNFAATIAVFAKKHPGLRFSFDPVLWGYLLKAGLPFALIYILSLLNFRVDVIMLSLMKGDTAAGVYNADFKLIEQFILIPITLSVVFLPIFSKSPFLFDRLNSIARKILSYLFAASIAATALLCLSGGLLVRIIYGSKFEAASQYIFLMALVLVPFFIKPVLEKILYVMKKQNVVCYIYTAGVGINIFLNVIMIPKWGINGSSSATVLSEFLVAFLCFIVYKKARFVHDETTAGIVSDKSLLASELMYD